jgi:hypothetical protein
VTLVCERGVAGDVPLAARAGGGGDGGGTDMMVVQSLRHKTQVSGRQQCLFGVCVQTFRNTKTQTDGRMHVSDASRRGCNRCRKRKVAEEGTRSG